MNNNELEISGLKIISKIGEGGMSVVYLAEQVSLKREVAAKVIRLEIAKNDLDVQRFKNEAKTIAQLDHPNIINIYSIGQTSKGEVYFTMPYLNHGDFSNYLLEDEQEFILLLQSICDGLSFAHDRGVVHRDIKPENLLFDKFGNVRIADFGIAITKDGNRMTKEHQVVGSAQYMSPEQARSQTVDVHSDIYSLGIVIYERLTGRVPFDGEDSISVLVNHVSSEPPPLPAKMRHWQSLIDKCLAKLPEDRFQSMVELKIELSKVPINSLQRTNLSIKQIFLDKNGRPKRWFVPSILVFLCAVFLGIAYSVYQKNSAVSDQNSIQVINDNSSGSRSEHTQKIAINSSSSKASTSEEQYQANNPKQPTATGVVQNTNPAATVTLIDGTAQSSIQETQQELNFHRINDDTTVDSIEASQAVTEVELLLKKALVNIARYQLLKPANDNATDQLLKVLDMSPDNSEAIKGLKAVAQKYYYLIDSSLNKNDLNTAFKHIKSFMIFERKSANLNDRFAIQQKAILDKLAKFDLTDESFDIERIGLLIEMVTTLSPESPMIAEFQKHITIKSGPQVGDVLLSESGVKTVVVDDKLAVGLTEVTVASYQKFAQATNRSANKCRHKGGGVSNFFSNKTWDNPYFKQQADHPVVCVSIGDAQAFINWLNQQTDETYRLLTLEEFQSLSALKNTPFEACQSANVAGSEANKLRNKEDKYACDDQYKFTAAVASFAANNLGIYDINGNVSEWVACQSSPCKTPVAVGSAWLHGQQSNVPKKQESLKTNAAFSYIGFRLARDL